MSRYRAIALAAALATFAGSAGAQMPVRLPATGFLQVLGSVSNAARPVANALVIALNLDDFQTFQTFSTADGKFSLPPLHAGIYKIIAVKQGFLPATAMVVPTRRDQRVALRMQSEKQAKGKSASQEMWEIRGSLPPDVLREIDMVMAPPVAIASASYDVPRFKGEMMSLTGVADQSASPAFAQTAVGVQSRIGDNWQLGFRGNLHRVDDPTDGTPFGSPLAEASVMQMELRSSPTDSVKLASTKSWWRYREDAPLSSHDADVRSHNIEWEHGAAHVQVRYLGQQNLFQTSPVGSDLIEVAGNTTLIQNAHSDFGVALRVTQESLRNVTGSTFRTADLSANASLELVPTLIVRYGMTSRVGLDGSEWAPRTGVQWKLTGNTSFIATGLYKVLDHPQSDSALPSLVMWSDDSRVLPHYSYSFGFVSGEDTSPERLSAIATVTALDSPFRVLFNDGFEQFWDGLYVDRGDIRRDLRVAYRREVGSKLAFDVSTSAGTATSTRTSDLHTAAKEYVTGDLQTTWRPSGTTLAVSYRHLRQPQEAGFGNDYRSERVNVRMAQSLHLPLNLKLLLGVEMARSANSPFLLDTFDLDGSRKYVGGLAVDF